MIALNPNPKPIEKRATAVAEFPKIIIGWKIKSGNTKSLHTKPKISAIKGGKSRILLRLLKKLVGWLLAKESMKGPMIEIGIAVANAS